MTYRSTAVPFTLNEAAVGQTRGVPAFFDFSVPIARAESWTATSEDIIESHVASLASKERRIANIMSQALLACEASGGAVSPALTEVMNTLSGHAEALRALYPSYSFQLTGATDRIRLAVVNACCALAAKLVSYRSSYTAKLYELYAAASEISIGYVTLQATALSLGDRCAAAVAARNLRHVGQLLLTLHQLVPYESVRELQSRGVNASTDELWEVAGVTNIA